MSKSDNPHWDFSLACDGLDFNQFAVDDPVPTGTQYSKPQTLTKQPACLRFCPTAISKMFD